MSADGVPIREGTLHIPAYILYDQRRSFVVINGSSSVGHNDDNYQGPLPPVAHNNSLLFAVLFVFLEYDNV